MGVCILCVCDSEEREHGVGAGVNDTMLLVVTSGLTSTDVRLTSGLRSPDEVDEIVGSITHLRFV